MLTGFVKLLHKIAYEKDVKKYEGITKVLINEMDEMYFDLKFAKLLNFQFVSCRFHMIT